MFEVLLMLEKLLLAGLFGLLKVIFKHFAGGYSRGCPMPCRQVSKMITTASTRFGVGTKRLNWVIVTRAHAPRQVYGGGTFLPSTLALLTVRARPGRLSALSVSHSKSVLYGALTCAHRVLNRPTRRFRARADRAHALHHREAPATQSEQEVGPEVGPTAAFSLAAFPQECMGQLASFGPT
jgi:hypothetical protein